jgi:hypothetical protein
VFGAVDTAKLVFIAGKRTRGARKRRFSGENTRLGLKFWQMAEKPSSPPDPPHSRKDPLVSLARYSEMGFIIPAAILLGFFLGKLADYWLHTKWLYLVGLLFGAVVGFWQMIRMAVGAFKDGR